MRSCLVCLLALAPFCHTGCFGYFLGLTDEKVKQLRHVVAELEIKNTALVEENLKLRQRLSELEGAMHGTPLPESGEPSGAGVVSRDREHKEKTCRD